MTCRHCGTEIAAKALICYRCGKATMDPRVQPPAEQSVFVGRRRTPWPAIAVAAALTVALALAAAWLMTAR
jgi:hypothetical protein